MSYTDYFALDMQSVEDLEPYIADEDRMVVIDGSEAAWGVLKQVRTNARDGIEVLLHPSRRCSTLIGAVRTVAPKLKYGWTAGPMWYPINMYDLIDWQESLGHEF